MMDEKSKSELRTANPICVICCAQRTGGVYQYVCGDCYAENDRIKPAAIASVVEDMGKALFRPWAVDALLFMIEFWRDQLRDVMKQGEEEENGE